MKKLFLLLVTAVMTLTASAQVYLGGEMNFWRDWENGANNTTFSIAPEIGYNLDESLSIGTTIGYAYSYLGGRVDTKVNAITISPYVRYTWLKLNNVNLFLDGGFGFGTYKTKVNDHSGDAQNAWEVGLKPGVSVNLTEQLSFIAHVGFFGYRTADDATAETFFGQNGFGLKLDGTDLRFGLVWNF